jgi:hypothetical protein
MRTKTTLPGVPALLQAARQEGSLSAESLSTLEVQDIGAQIQAALGTPADDVPASEVLLVTMLIDDSGSIRLVPGNEEAVRQGHNEVLDALAATKQADSILVHTRFLNGHVLFPYCPLARAQRLDAHNYDPCLGTPLYDETVVLLGTVLAKAQEFTANGVPARSLTLLVTDGNDQHSTRMNAGNVRSLVEDLLKAETHIIAAMGVDDHSVDFRLVFRGMGIPDRWILTPGNKAAEIRRAFAIVSRSVVQASQNAQSFSLAALGGFGPPGARPAGGSP